MKNLLTILTIVIFSLVFLPSAAQVQAEESHGYTNINQEPNEIYSSATPIELNKEYQSTFADDDFRRGSKDIYKIQLPASGVVTVNADSNHVNGIVVVKLSNGKVNNEYLKYTSDPSLIEDETGQVGLPAGTYYLELSAGTNILDVTYHFSVSFEPGNYYEKEDNDTWDLANNIELNKRYKGFFVTNPRTDDGDTYKFTLTKDSTIIIKHRKYPNSYGNLRIYDSSGKQIFIDHLLNELPVKGADRINEVSLKAGTYFLELAEYINVNKASFPYELEVEVKKTTDKYPWIGRVLIQKAGMALYNPQGKVHRTLKKGEGLKVYEIQDDRYQVGGGYYVLKGNGKDTLYYFGHVWGKTKYMTVNTPEGRFYKKFAPKQTVRVYGIEDGKYEVGGGYYVLPDTNVQLDR